MKQISLPFALRPLLLACGICLAATPTFASNAPRSPASGLPNLIFTRDVAPDQPLCLSGDAPATVLARVTTALPLASLHPAEPGFVLFDDVGSAPGPVKAAAGTELAALASRGTDREQLPSSAEVFGKASVTASKFAHLADIPREWADKAKALSAHISEKFNVDESYASKVVKAVMKAGDQTGLSPNLLLAVIAVESNFNAAARNGNARGLMQIIPFWHKQKVNQVGGPKELMKSDKNIAVGSAILKEYLDRSENVFQALTRYNASSHAQEYSAKVLKQQKGFDAVFVPAPR